MNYYKAPSNEVQSADLGQGGHFVLKSCGPLAQIIGSQVIQFIFLKIVTLDSERDSEHFLASHCHSSEHNSVLLVLQKHIFW